MEHMYSVKADQLILVQSHGTFGVGVLESDSASCCLVIAVCEI
jgi:hypothetical protein